MKDKVDQLVEGLVEGYISSQYERAIFEINALVVRTQEFKRVMGSYSESEEASSYFKEIADEALDANRALSRAVTNLQHNL